MNFLFFLGLISYYQQKLKKKINKFFDLINLGIKLTPKPDTEVLFS